MHLAHHGDGVIEGFRVGQAGRDQGFHLAHVGIERIERRGARTRIVEFAGEHFKAHRGDGHHGRGDGQRLTVLRGVAHPAGRGQALL